MSAVVVIPVYKPDMNPYEELSFRNCCEVLRQHPIHLITFKDLSLDRYREVYDGFKVTFFDPSYFESISGYNRLMLSLDFYNAFRSFDFMLIHQLDAYVFRDELGFWCDQGFDYIGAPWITKDGDELWRVGNGGFSLRNIPSFINVLDNRKPVYRYRQLLAQYQEIHDRKRIFSIISSLVRSTGFRNNVQFFVQSFMHNEDWFWSEIAREVDERFKVSDVHTGLKFSFEYLPGMLYTMNNNKLPFGCHAWEKSPGFWESHIPGMKKLLQA
ncbi:MAG: hypothetical protein KDD36_02255 [Flavobacteriales bacterium]|nr:hypothetical protein [Flavobacteriales bacterium]